MTTHGPPTTDLLTAALVDPDPSVRLRVALDIGTLADVRFIDILVERAGLEPDFFVRDMLTWSLCRLPAALTVPRLLAALDSDGPAARSQALHTLSKIGDGAAWPGVKSMLHDDHDDVVRSAWRAAVAVVPAGGEHALAVELAAELGRGDRDVQLSLSRALAALGDDAVEVVSAAMDDPDPHVQAHARATEQLRLDPESTFAVSVDDAKRVVVLGPCPRR